MEGLSQANVLHEVLYLQAHDNGFKKKNSIRSEIKEHKRSKSPINFDSRLGAVRRRSVKVSQEDSELTFCPMISLSRFASSWRLAGDGWSVTVQIPSRGTQAMTWHG